MKRILLGCLALFCVPLANAWEFTSQMCTASIVSSSHNGVSGYHSRGVFAANGPTTEGRITHSFGLEIGGRGSISWACTSYASLKAVFKVYAVKEAGDPSAPSSFSGTCSVYKDASTMQSAEIFGTGSFYSLAYALADGVSSSSSIGITTDYDEDSSLETDSAEISISAALVGQVSGLSDTYEYTVEVTKPTSVEINTLLSVLAPNLFQSSQVGTAFLAIELLTLNGEVVDDVDL